jgi:hypothetical protein
MANAGISCGVVAPSLMPRRPGNRFKTDERDAKELAMSLRAGTLEFVPIPSGEEEEVQGLIRCREDIARLVRLFKVTVYHWLLSRDTGCKAGGPACLPKRCRRVTRPRPGYGRMVSFPRNANAIVNLQRGKE